MKRLQNSAAAPPRRTLLGTLLLVLVAHWVGLFGASERPHDQTPTEPPKETSLRWLATDLQARNTLAPAKAPKPRASKAITEGLPTAQAPEPLPEPHTEAAPDEASLAKAAADSAANPAPDTPEQEPPAPAAPTEAPLSPAEQAAPPPALVQAPSGAPAEAGDAVALHQLSGAVPAAALLHFRLKGERGPGVYHARAELGWQHNQQQYRASFRAWMLFLGERTQVSSGSIGPSGLSPSKYTDLWRKNERAVHFDASQQRLVFSASQNKPLLWPGAQDLLSATVQMSSKLSTASGQALPVGQRVWLQAAHIREANIWVVERGPNTMLETPKGMVQTSHWIKPATHPADPRMEVWYALPSDNSPAAISRVWPLRLRISQANGDYLDQWLEKVEPLPDLVQGAADGKNQSP